MKKFFALFVTFAMLFSMGISLVGCGGGDKKDEKKEAKEAKEAKK